MEQLRLSMSTRTRIGGCLAFYGCLLLLLAWVAGESGGNAISATPIWVGAAGLLCLGFGIKMASGRPGKTGALLTLAAVGYVLIVEAVHLWVSGAAGSAVLVPVLTTMLFLTTLLLLAWLAHGKTTKAARRTGSAVGSADLHPTEPGH